MSIKTEDAQTKMNVTFSVDGRIITCFDIKQMICHLLGIGVKILNEPTDKKLSFLYLCYNPKLIEIIDEKKKVSIFKIYDKMCAECNAIDFVKLFGTIIKYLHQELNVGTKTDKEIIEILSNFKFTLCDQSDFIAYIN